MAKKRYVDKYEMQNGDQFCVEIKYNKGETKLCFGINDKTAYELITPSAPDLLRVLVAAEIQLNKLMDDNSIPLPSLPEEISRSLENDMRIFGIGKKNFN